MKKQKKGYSLVEVLAAFAIISIAILPIMSMYPAIFKTNTSASQIEEASRITLTIVDFIKAKGYKRLMGVATNLNVENGNGKIVDVAGSNPSGITYKFKNVSGGFITLKGSTEYALDKDLNFTSSAITNINDAFVVLNSKGLNLRDCTLKIIMKQENVSLITSEGALMSTTVINPKTGNGISSTTGSATSVMYGSVTNPEKFIVGRVILGWGNDKTVTSPVGRQQLDQSLTGKEKVYGVNFVVTPIEN